MKDKLPARNRASGIIAMVLFCILACSSASGFAAEPSTRVDQTLNPETASALSLQVYKKWIGASGNEADVEIDLFCPQGLDFEPRFINRDKPDGWEIEDVPDGGFFCSVLEIEDETFVGDVGDCKDLLILPGQDAECTIVNTKVVKRIDMLNRYGLFMMIAVMLGAGLAAVRKFGAF